MEEKNKIIDLANIVPDNVYGNFLGLDIKDPVCSAFNHAFFFNKHLIEKGRKPLYVNMSKNLIKLQSKRCNCPKPYNL